MNIADTWALLMGELGHSYQAVSDWPLWAVRLAVIGYNNKVEREQITSLHSARIAGWLSSRHNYKGADTPEAMMWLPGDKELPKPKEIIKDQAYWEEVIKRYDN